MAAASLKSRKSFLIDSLLEERQRKLKSEASTASEDQTEDSENEAASITESERSKTIDSEVSIESTTATPSSMNPPNNTQINFINAFARLMAANSMQNFMLSQTSSNSASASEYAARFRMLNLNAMAPSLAAFGQTQFNKTMIPTFPFNIRPEGPSTNHRLSLGSTNHFERLMSSSSLSSARSSCSSSAGSITTAPSSTSTSTTIRSSNVKKYRCDICDKTFSRSNTLITHKRIHTGEKPFRCEVCSRAFRQPGNLTRHRLTHTTSSNPLISQQPQQQQHQQQRLLHCTTCSKSFIHKSELRSHFCTGKSLIS